MAFDAYIKIEGIPGEALDEQHRNWIEVNSYSFGTQQSTSATASSAFFNRHLTKNPLTVTGSAGFHYCGSAKPDIPPQRQEN
jgi:type VI protein secretion system component Hcp